MAVAERDPSPARPVAETQVRTQPGSILQLRTGRTLTRNHAGDPQRGGLQAALLLWVCNTCGAWVLPPPPACPKDLVFPNDLGLDADSAPNRFVAF